MEFDKNELRRERARLIAEGRALLNKAEKEKRELNAAEEQRFKEILGAIDWMARQIGGLSTSDQTSFDEIEAELSKSQGTIVGGKEPIEGQRWYENPGEIRVLRREQKIAENRSYNLPDGIRPDELSLGRLLRGVVSGNWHGAEAERRALSEGTDTLGGYLVPEPLALRVIDLARNQARVMEAGALTVPMEESSLKMARVTSDPTAYWRAENEAITESDMTFGAITLYAKALAALCRVSIELIEDAVNMPQLVESALSQALALELDRAALFGNGVSEPMGLYNTADVQKVDMGTNGAALTSFAPFSQAVQKVQEANGSPKALIWAPRTAGEVDRLVDTTGQPLRPPASFEALSKLATKQVPVNLTHGTATNATCVFVGDFSQMLIGMRTNLTLEVARQAADAFGKLQVLIRAYLRADVQVARPPHFCIVDGIIPPA
ncbi:MAG: phage major capsid protein [Firmicutes bacterium]|nr:phage major capsid protein [Bacillota bacterium]